MNDTGTDDDYDIAVRQFQQQILPGGHWNTLSPACAASPGLCNLPATTVWSYGPASDPKPDSSGIPGGAEGLAPAPNSQFNYPAYTIENTIDAETTVDWINDLVVDPWDNTDRSYIPHLLPIDRTLHWANPEQLPCAEPGKTKDCRPDPSNPGLGEPYEGPVPIVVHVHGAHTRPESDGYPEAWWLPAASNIPEGYATTGTLVNQFDPRPDTNVNPGVGSFSYLNDQPSTTLWYHDHALGMTRNNVYAGPAGFWLIREDDGGETGLDSGILPSPAPVAGEGLVETNVTGRGKYREIPIVIQDRSFNTDGSLFYPANRAFFEGLGNGQDTAGNQAAGLDIPFYGTDDSDIAPIWNPEAFFNVMVVNGVSWPELEVAPAIYRFRLLNGCNSRFLNLSMKVVNKKGATGKELPFYQIGAEQSLLPQVVEVRTGKKTPIANGALWEQLCVVEPTNKCERFNAGSNREALLMGLAERADVLVDFRGLKNGTVVRMLNTAPDAPFGGFPDIPADPATTGQIMQFRVNSALLGQGATDPVLADGTPNPDAATSPWNVALSLPDPSDPAAGPANVCPGPHCQDLALLEEESATVCATISPTGTITYDAACTPDLMNPGTCVDAMGALCASLPFAPKAAVLGVNGSGGGTVQLWSDSIEQNPDLDETETWELWNWSADAHPIHLHLVKFKVVNREPFDVLTGALLGPRPAEATEAGWKDTVIAYPGEVTRVNATFDILGLYVWHCHIVEHEDNEMMVPYCVGDQNNLGCATANGNL
jgi:FtsP/CotA-like multicopper oxidase with cupredoxin domain